MVNLKKLLHTRHARKLYEDLSVNRRIILFVGIGILSLIVMSYIMSGVATKTRASIGDPQFSFTPNTMTTQVGSSFLVNFLLTNPSSGTIANAKVVLKYYPQYLQYESYSGIDLNLLHTNTTGPDGDGYMRTELYLSNMNSSHTAPFYGTITFKALASSGSSSTTMFFEGVRYSEAWIYSLITPPSGVPPLPVFRDITADSATGELSVSILPSGTTPSPTPISTLSPTPTTALIPRPSYDIYVNNELHYYYPISPNPYVAPVTEILAGIVDPEFPSVITDFTYNPTWEERTLCGCKDWVVPGNVVRFQIIGNAPLITSSNWNIAGRWYYKSGYLPPDITLTQTPTPTRTPTRTPSPTPTSLQAPVARLLSTNHIPNQAGKLNFEFNHITNINNYKVYVKHHNDPEITPTFACVANPCTYTTTMTWALNETGYFKVAQKVGDVVGASSNTVMVDLRLGSIPYVDAFEPVESPQILGNVRFKFPKASLATDYKIARSWYPGTTMNCNGAPNVCTDADNPSLKWFSPSTIFSKYQIIWATFTPVIYGLEGPGITKFYTLSGNAPTATPTLTPTPTPHS